MPQRPAPRWQFPAAVGGTGSGNASLAGVCGLSPFPFCPAASRGGAQPSHRGVQLETLRGHARRVGRSGCCCPNLAETLKEPREMWIDRYNPKLHYLVLGFSFVSVQQIDL